MTDTARTSIDDSSQPPNPDERPPKSPASPLPSASSKQTRESTPSKDEDAAPPAEKFLCTLCGLAELFDYKGKEPPFTNGICFTESCYVMHDPFAPPLYRTRSKPEYFIVLGAHCRLCDRVVCKGRKCSVYYDSTFCRNCALSHLEIFPEEIREKTRKGFSA